VGTRSGPADGKPAGLAYAGDDVVNREDIAPHGHLLIVRLLSYKEGWGGPMRLQGKVVVITGSRSGLGREGALLFAPEGELRTQIRG